ncbi:cobalamin B12-binding domain-containing protein [Boseongicola aestuarii]|uniref:B12 binding domain protein n=1 Tax=Boseongicola aestuarii TaxID=1470561 RepID=A0A238IXD2_9RHOB|nr:cobalamin B12-binding domain-containing protein [Boseongicola aestuarii]SMX23139.1 B12 binding domain protein [Boseongicola aestuarii]
MRSDGPSGKPLDIDVYVRSQAELRSLKSQLPEDTVASLAREVIRRLASREIQSSVNTPSEDAIAQLCHALLSDDDTAGAQYIQEIETDGATVEVVYLQYLARAAQLLGVWWEEDKISFMSVTLGTSRMYAIMRGMQHRFAVPRAPLKRSALFASVPGETHTLGVRMAADLFRQDGWDINLKLGLTHEELLKHVEGSDAVLVGVSAAGEHSIRALSQLVVALRISNPNTKLFVSGNVVVKASEQIALMGLDGTAADIKTAREVMAKLWTDVSDKRSTA